MSNEIKKKIVIFTATYPIMDSAGIFVKDHAKMLASYGYEVTVLYIKGVKKIDGGCNIITHCFDEGIEIYIKEELIVAATYTVPLTKIKMKRAGQALFLSYFSEHGQPDFAFSHFSFPSGIAAAYVCNKYKIKYIAVEHLSLLLGEKKPWLNNVLANTLETADAFVCVSEGLKEGVCRRVKRNKQIYVIPNPLDPIFSFSPIQKKSEFIFFSAGHLIPVKNYEALINAFALAFPNEQNVRLRIAGNGNKGKFLRNKIKELDLCSRVELVGEISREQMLQEYQHCDCFVSASLAETFGIVSREALIVGRPVLSTPTEGIKFGWSAANGLITNGFSTNDIADGLRRIYENNDGFDCKAISEYANQVFSVEAVGAEYVKLMNMIGNVD